MNPTLHNLHINFTWNIPPPPLTAHVDLGARCCIEGRGLLLQTGVRGTVVGVQARVRLGRKKRTKETRNTEWQGRVGGGGVDEGKFATCG